MSKGNVYVDKPDLRMVGHDRNELRITSPDGSIKLNVGRVKRDISRVDGAESASYSAKCDCLVVILPRHLWVGMHTKQITAIATRVEKAIRDHQ